MRALLSINPEHVANIFNGTKKYEFRRKLFLRTDIKTVIIYSTRPVCKIVGEFDVEKVVRNTPREVWFETSSQAGISKNFFDTYFFGRDVAYALKIGAVRIYDKPVCPKSISKTFSPPQSYMYVAGDKGFDWLQRKQAELFPN